jgi:GYD domain
VGGKLEAYYYYAFGDRDVCTIVDLADNATAAAASAAVGAGGAAKVTTVILITPEEMDEMGKKNVQAYFPSRALGRSGTRPGELIAGRAQTVTGQASSARLGSRRERTGAAEASRRQRPPSTSMRAHCDGQSDRPSPALQSGEYGTPLLGLVKPRGSRTRLSRGRDLR